MSLALEIAKRKSGTAKKAAPATPAAIVGADAVVHVGGVVEKDMTVAEASKAFADADAQVKELEAYKKSIGEALKGAGVAALREAEEAGRYFAKAVVGMVQVCRQNKYRPVDIASKAELVGALGLTEYASLFDEKASIEFDSIDAMRGFMAQCQQVGIVIPGNVTELTVPRSSFAERKCQLVAALDADKRALLDAIGGDTTFSISTRKE